MYLITWETANFHFCYVSQSQSLDPLRKAWAKHCQQTQADKNYLTQHKDAVKILKIEFNRVYRDYEQTAFFDPVI
jgi:hypothetical protein